ncbi:PLP-dependent aminotransferase family protein [Amphritea sp. 2_MG-2023]|uniref:aminotransferase-like domain-containing protein n=1 Tax=Amphritea TaxID=515417 RepID=UPI001C078395|nr:MULTISPECIES: PLP-dependent aminotransferase family protein [Amphritea]MBU2967314.1 PLP-dependent aminotransferase family protein [Amphritea atlantica]MDO6420462.1 PLP-dependent aminotransferase family protein [Amphritea sp. 2_MG-2023]
MSKDSQAQSAKPLYAKIADELTDMIASGVLAEGDRLPSLRMLSKSHAVSVPTVVEAYRVLEDRGVVTPLNRSGYYVKRREDFFQPPKPVRPIGSPTKIMQKEATQLVMTAAQNPGLLPFGAAVPSPSLFPITRLKSIMSRLLRHKPELLGSYDFAPGSMELRRELARRSLRWGCTIDPEAIVVTNGCVEAISLALRAVTKPGDIVAVETPTYYGFLSLLEVLGLQALEIPCDPVNGLSVDEFTKALRKFDVTACLLCSTVSNPTGATIPVKKKRELAELACRHDFMIIEDATFADLHFNGETLSIKSFDTDGYVILCASATKTTAPGLRLGWVEGGKVSDQISYLKRVSSIGQPQINQLVLAEYMASGGYERHLRQLVRTIRKQLDQHCTAIADSFPSGLTAVPPSGGFLLWLELSSEIDGLELHNRALSFGIGLAPGEMFSANGLFSNYLRVNCGQVYTDEIRTAYARLGSLLTDMM